MEQDDDIAAIEEARLLAGMPQSRFSIFGIDQATLQLTRSLSPVVAPDFAAGFRTHIERLLRHPTMGEIARVHGGVLERALAEHGSRVFEARFDEDYLTSLGKVVTVQAETPFGARAHCVLTLVAARSAFVEIGCRNRFSGRRTARDCVKLVELLMMDLASSMDIVSRKHGRQIVRRAAQIEDLTLGFRDKVAEVSEAASETSGLLSRVSGDCAHASRSAGHSMTASRESLGRVRQVVAHTAVSTEQLRQSIGEIDRRTREGAGIAQEAVAAAGDAQQTIESLAELVGEIGSVVSMISDIAAQTNLLALNATIEAARAGDAGRGFAVVASEVKDLSAQTTSATATIAARIEAIRAATQRCVGSIGRIDAAVKGMADVSSAIAGALGEQLAVTQGMAQDAHGASGEVETALDLVAQTFSAVQHVGASVEEMNARSASVGHVADDLARSLNGFAASVAERLAS